MARTMNTGGLLLASAVAGLMLAAGVPGTAGAEEKEEVRCYGVNKCKGTGDCGGKGHSCAGKNACKGQGYLKMDKETCLKVQGGRLTPEAEEG
jgi:uncharacterized membrane protein